MNETITISVIINSSFSIKSTKGIHLCCWFVRGKAKNRVEQRSAPFGFLRTNTCVSYDKPCTGACASAPAHRIDILPCASCLHSAAGTEAETLEQTSHIAHPSIPKLQKIHPVTSSSSTSKIPPTFPYIIPHICFY